MDDFAELEISLSSTNGTRCQAKMRFRPANSPSEIRVGTGDNGSAAESIELGNLGDRELEPEAYARKLTQAMFASPTLAQGLSEALAVCAADSSTLRIRLWIEADNSPLHDICWEMLRNPRDDTRLACGERILFSRGLSTLSARPLSLKAPEDARALLVAANPDGLAGYKMAPIEAQTELDRAQTNLGELSATRRLPDGKARRATYDDIFAELGEEVDILYLVCHGTTGANESWLWLEEADGRLKRVPAGDFVARMRGLRAYPELVVLISCKSAGGKSGPTWRALGPKLVKAGIPAVLAMQGNFSMESEALFLPHFFQALREHGQADLALSYARSFIAERHDWWMPVLFSHLRDNRVFGRSNPLAAASLKVQPFEPETVYIPGGNFWMGTDDEKAPAYEKPRHAVELPPYRIGKYPVTNRQYAEFIKQAKRIAPPEMGWSGQNPPAGKLEHPVQGLSWYEAKEYCGWLSTKTGRVYRLPSEAEWEKAARGEDGRRYPWGETWDAARCASPGASSAVNALPAQSKYGCHDMVGNIREWCLSLWGQNRNAPDPAYCYPWAQDGRNDPDANKLVRRAVRGAGDSDASESQTCYARNSYAPDKAGPPGKRHGLRVVMEIN